MPFQLAKYRVVPMILVMGTIFLLSHQPGDTLDLGTIPGTDKLAHLMAYGLLAATVLLAHHPRTRQANRLKTSLTTVLVCLVYGLFDEYHQSFVPGRFVSAGDVLADVTGAILVTAFWWLRQRQRGTAARRSLG